MRNILLSIALICLPISVSSQTTTQRGVTYRYNGNKERTPLGNVTITYNGNKRTTLSNEHSGEFTLTLDNCKMGERIGVVTVKKRDMMVFNKQAVEEWSVRKEPLRLILCDADEFERQKENLINIGKREAKRKYDRQKAAFEQQLRESRIKQQEYESELDKAYEELERARKHMDEYADLFARIDESEIDTLAQRAVALFNQGEVNVAIRLFEQGNYMEKLDKAIKTSQQADQLKAVAEQSKKQATEDSLKALESLKAQIEAYKVNNEWQKAGELLKGLADKLQTVQSMADYAGFCAQQKDYETSKRYLQKAIDMQERQLDKGSNDWQLRMFGLCHSLGDILRLNKEFASSELQLKKSLELLSALSSSTETYHQELFEVRNTLGNLYENAQQYDKAEREFLEAERLANSLPTDANGQLLARIHNNLGVLYFRTRHFAQSETNYLKCRDYYQQRLGIMSNTIPANSQDEYLRYHYAGLLLNLANLYKGINRFDDSKACFNQTVSMVQKLSEFNREAYEPLSAMVYKDFAMLLRMVKSYRESTEMGSEAVTRFRTLAIRNPQAFNPYLAITLYELGETYGMESQHQQAEAYLNEALDMLRPLALAYPSLYESRMAQVLYDTGYLRIQLGQNALAIPPFEEALEIYRRIAKTDSTHQQGYLASLDFLRQLYLAQNNHEAAYRINQEFLPLLKERYEANAVALRQYYAQTLGNQAYHAIFMKQFAEAEQLAREGLAVDSTQHYINANLAASFLFRGKYAEAEKIYRQYKAELKDGILDGLGKFAEAGVVPIKYEADVERIIRLLNE